MVELPVEPPAGALLVDPPPTALDPLDDLDPPRACEPPAAVELLRAVLLPPVDSVSVELAPPSFSVDSPLDEFFVPPPLPTVLVLLPPLAVVPPLELLVVLAESEPPDSDALPPAAAGGVASWLHASRHSVTVARKATEYLGL